MKAIINRFNAEIITEGDEERRKLVQFFWNNLIKETDPVVIKHTPDGKAPSWSDKKIGTRYDVSFYNTWTGTGFLIPISMYYHIKHIIQSMIGSKITEDLRMEAAPARDAVFRLRNGYEPRDYQKEVLDFLDKDTHTANKLVGMPTGTGKTMTIFFRMVKIQKVTVIILRPFLMKQWKRELMKVLKLEDEDILTVTGGKALKNLLNSIRTKSCEHKVYIISNKTFYFYLKSFHGSSKTYKDDDVIRYEKGLAAEAEAKMIVLRNTDSDMYDMLRLKQMKIDDKLALESYKAEYSDIPPREFLTGLGAGLLTIDEAHLDPHLNNTIYSTMGNIPHQVSLSATYFSSDKFLSHIFDWTYSKFNIYDQLKAKKYIDYRIMAYSSPSVKKVHYSLAGRYNHNKYETKFLMRQGIYSNYKKMVFTSIDGYYMAGRKKDDKILIFFTSLAMVEDMTLVAKEMYPDLNVIKYTGAEKDDSILLDAEIIFATVGKAAVGLDLKNLMVVLNFISILSDSLSVQILGRLREISNRTPRFIQFVCKSIPTHAKHAKARRRRLEERTKHMEVIHYKDII